MCQAAAGELIKRCRGSRRNLLITSREGGGRGYGFRLLEQSIGLVGNGSEKQDYQDYGGLGLHVVKLDRDPKTDQPKSRSWHPDLGGYFIKFAPATKACAVRVRASPWQYRRPRIFQRRHQISVSGP